MNATSPLIRAGQLLAAVLLLAGTPAFADNTTMQTASFSISGVSGSQGVTFDGFDTSLGTLTGVTINLTDVQVNGYGTLTATAAAQQIFSAYLDSKFNLLDLANNKDVTVEVTTTDGATGNSVANGSTYFVGGAGSPGNGYIQTAANGGTTPPSGFNPASGGPIDGTATTITTGLGSYETPTTITLNVSGTNLLQSGTTGNFSTTVVDTTTGIATLYYTYTPVPEPSKTAACMIAFGLVLLVGRHYFKGRGLCLA